jgi:5-deoxy-glucuronate isomerase
VNDEVIHAAALPNDLPSEALRRRPAENGEVFVVPRTAGWRYLTFHTNGLPPGTALELGSPGRETLVVILGGGGIDAQTPDGRRFAVDGRADPFAALPWALYVPEGPFGVTARVGTSGGATEAEIVRLAVAVAPRSGRGGVSDGPIVIGPDDVEIEVRGAGNATRQITHIVPPAFPADRLLCVEVHTPSGNWSSWPPHKHDRDDMPNEAVLEEIYCYQFRRPEAWGIQRLYRRPGDGAARDALWAVKHGDVVLVTDGYHPFAAAHGDDAYYLNALAGDRRTMACSFDPDLDWTRDSWASIAPDPRVPLVPGAREREGVETSPSEVPAV